MIRSTTVAAASRSLRHASPGALVVAEGPTGPRFPNGYIPHDSQPSTTRSGASPAAGPSPSPTTGPSPSPTAGPGASLVAGVAAAGGLGPVVGTGAGIERPIVARRWWDPRLRVSALDSSRVARFLVMAEPMPLPAAPEACLGWGPGLTPAADDVVVGMLIGFRATGAPELARSLADACAGMDTVPFSRALVDHAAAGEAVRPVLDLMAALAGHGSLERAVEVLRCFGATSGRHLLDGTRRALLEAPALSAARRDGGTSLVSDTQRPQTEGEVPA